MERFPEITDKEILGIMVDGARQLCEYAKTQWISGKYGELGTPQVNENYQQWCEIQRKISDLRHRITEALKAGSL